MEEVVNTNGRGLDEKIVLEYLQNESLSAINQDAKKLFINLLVKLNNIRSKIDGIESNSNSQTSSSDNLKTLKKHIFEIEDIITACSYRILKKKIQVIASDDQVWNKETGERLVSIDKALEDGLKNVKFKGGHYRPTFSNIEQPTGCLPNQHKIFGRDKDIDMIIEKIWEKNDSGPHIIHITGPSGIGKTSLLQHVYIDKRVSKDQSIHKGWVFLGKDIDLKSLTQHIFECITKEPWQNNTEEAKYVKHQIRNNLESDIPQVKKCLLILDDVWEAGNKFWNEFWKDGFINTLKRFVILVTSQDTCVTNSIVEAMNEVGSSEHIVLGRLDDVSSRQLFFSCKFGATKGVESNEDSHKNDGSEKIIRNCKGVPTILKNSARSFFRDCAGTKRDIQHLKTMYRKLPERMKRCISYCSLFPDYHQVESDFMVKLWIAEGFIHSDSGKSFEEISLGYFHDLWNKSFFRFMPTSEKYEALPVNFWDSLPSECYKRQCGDKPSTESESALQTQNAQLQYNSTLLIASDMSLRRIHLNLFPKSFIQNSNSLSTNIRHSFIVVTSGKNENNTISIENATKSLFSMLYKMKYLRSLDLSCTDVEELPYNFGSNLVHLHFLGLNSTPIKILPDSICKLYSLHTLELRKCKNLQELPKDIGSMISLTHLDISMDLTTFCMPSGIGKLSKLKTLGRFNVGRHGEYAGIKELEELNNLTGEVCISGLCNVVDPTDCESAHLEKKEHIEEVTLSWFPHDVDSESNYHHSCEGSSSSEKVLENLKPHNKLLSLKIVSYDGSKFPKWMDDDSFKVRSMKLENCSNKELLQVPSFGILPVLQYLCLDSMFLKKIGLEFFHAGNHRGKCFPELRELEFRNLHELEEIQEWSEFCKDTFPVLCKVTFFNCPLLKKIPRFKCAKLRKLEIERCGALRTFPEVITDEELCLILTACDGIEKISIPKGTTVTTLTLRYCTGLSSLPEYSVLQKLKHLHLEDCENLTSQELAVFLQKERNSLSTGITLNCPQLEFSMYTISKDGKKNGGDLTLGQEVHVMKQDSTNLCAARGKVVLNLSSDEVGGIKLGNNFVGVLVDKIIDREEELIRSYSSYEKIGDVLGQTIAWSRTRLRKNRIILIEHPTN